MENLPEQKNPENKNSKQKVVGFLMFEAAIEFALLIAVPLIGFILLGKWLDTKWHTHFMVILGILLALAISSMAIYKKINDYKKLLK